MHRRRDPAGRTCIAGKTATVNTHDSHSLAVLVLCTLPWSNGCNENIMMFKLVNLLGVCDSEYFKLKWSSEA